MARRRGSVLLGTVVASLLFVLLSWLPLLGPFIAGYAGGKRAGTATRGLATALLAGTVLTIGLVVLAFYYPFWGSIAAGILLTILVVTGLLFVGGAVVGGAVA
ncbi:MAG TPA: hypothetical protein VNZ52_09035 [Candidatus Thermoplasmatota archaeon]|nr:hypothetical protein [Candidatus Thermoplasmatota archaeon]